MRHLFLAAALGLSALAGAQTQTSSTYPTSTVMPLMVPDGVGPNCATSTAGPVVTAAAYATNPGQITSVTVSLGIATQWIDDQRLYLTHNGVTVPLMSGAPGIACGSSSDLNGVYVFDDAAPQSLQAAATAAGGGVVAPGAYRPASPLAAFATLEACGPWTLSCVDDVQDFAANISSFTLTVTTGMSNVADSTVVAVPPGFGVPCSSTAPGIPLLRTINVPKVGEIDQVVATLGLNTDFFSGLDVTLQHAAVSCKLLQPFNLGACSLVSNADLDGHYVLDDDAILGTMAAGLAGGALAPGRYRPVTPLSVFDGLEASGSWTLLVTNREIVKPATLTYLRLSIRYKNGYVTTIHQPLAGGPIELHTGNGTPGEIYFNAVSLAPQGNGPGIWFGLEISFFDLVSQATSGPPFVGLLDACGQATLIVPPGAVPPGITLAYVGASFDTTGQVTALDAVRTFTTM
jgi:hypothetical protein